MSTELEIGAEPENSFEDASNVLSEALVLSNDSNAETRALRKSVLGEKPAGERPLQARGESVSGSEIYGTIMNRYRGVTLKRNLLTHAEELELGETIAEARNELAVVVGQYRPSLECFLGALDRAELGEVPASDVTRSVFSVTATDRPGKSQAGRSQPWREHAVVLKQLLTEDNGGDVSRITSTLMQIDPAYPALRDAVSVLEAASGADTAVTHDETSASLAVGTQDLSQRAKAGASRYLAARRRLVESNLRLVFHFATKLVGRGLSYEDLVQEGILGLMRAADKYDYTLRFRFSTYASNWIQQALHRALANTSRQIRVPSDVHDVIVRIANCARRLTQKMGREPTPEEIAQDLDMDVEKVRRSVRANFASISLESPVNESESADLKSLIVDTAQPAADLVQGQAELHREVALLLEALPEREAKILRMRYGIGLRSPMTLEQIGSSLGITRERTRQLERRALERLEELIGGKDVLL